LAGGGAFLAAMGGKRLFNPPDGFSVDDEAPSQSTLATPADPLRFACPRCGAALGEGAEVSPHGDVKCAYCQSWFNVHQK
jgi:hypothetical protein